MSPSTHNGSNRTPQLIAAAAVAAILLFLNPFAAPAQADQDPQTSAAETRQSTITWTLVRVQNPTADQQDAYARITSAMNAAVARYNNLSDLGKNITVHYDPNVPTADGNINGTIRFGAKASMNERTALHEISHTIGVGTSGDWGSLGCGGTYNGAQATALVRQYDGSSAAIKCDGSHFWPYGLNYDSEFSQTNADRHVEIVEAMVRDGL
ncbi:hypothetical protein [Glycomyces rhizosphaerae]|uniref:Uncharacterized protein n=1 Tax=Glycomyces rhizosphaerae TaxID=2054422 RepID=A0ABV7PZB6_9ACTN